jgi:glycine betaine/proline transport system permease protein
VAVAGLFAAVGWSRPGDLTVQAPAVPLADWVDAVIDWLVRSFGDAFGAVNDVAVYWIGVLERFLGRTVAWPLVIAVAAGVAYHATRRLWLPAGVALALLFVWLLQLWVPTMQTLSLMIVAIAATLIVGLPVGIVMARHDRFRAALLPVLDLMQTMPSLVYLIPGVMLFGLGAFSAVLATMVYAAPPLIRLTDLGIRQVDEEVTEAAVSFGASRRQILWSVQLPLALPSIMTGINQAIMMSLAMVVIASMIGVSGLGQEVLQGLMRQQPGKGFAAGIAIVLLAIVLDRITQAYGRRGDVRKAG